MELCNKGLNSLAKKIKMQKTIKMYLFYFTGDMVLTIMMVKDPCQPLAEPSLDFVHQVVLVEVGGLLLLWMKLFMPYVMTLSR